MLPKLLHKEAISNRTKKAAPAIIIVVVVQQNQLQTGAISSWSLSKSFVIQVNTCFLYIIPIVTGFTMASLIFLNSSTP